MEDTPSRHPVECPPPCSATGSVTCWTGPLAEPMWRAQPVDQSKSIQLQCTLCRCPGRGTLHKAHFPQPSRSQFKIKLNVTKCIQMASFPLPCLSLCFTSSSIMEGNRLSQNMHTYRKQMKIQMNVTLTAPVSCTLSVCLLNLFFSFLSTMDRERCSKKKKKKMKKSTHAESKWRSN